MTPWDWIASVVEGIGSFINGGLDWALDLVQSVDPVARILLAGVGILVAPLAASAVCSISPRRSRPSPSGTSSNIPSA